MDLLGLCLLEHLQQPPNAPRAKNYFAARLSYLARRAALASAAALKCNMRAASAVRKNAARATLAQITYALQTQEKD